MVIVYEIEGIIKKDSNLTYKFEVICKKLYIPPKIVSPYNVNNILKNIGIET